METYVMSKIDDHEIDCYHQYIAQTNYPIERPEDGDGLILEPRGCFDKPQEIYKPVSNCNCSNGPRSFGDVGYRAAARERRAPEIGRIGMHNVRNGLHTPRGSRSVCGDFYNSMPGLGRYERPTAQSTQRNAWYFTTF